MKLINCSIASIVEIEGQTYFRMVIDNGVLSYSKLVTNDYEVNNAIKNAINIVKSIPAYINYVSELEALLIT